MPNVWDRFLTKIIRPITVVGSEMLRFHARHHFVFSLNSFHLRYGFITHMTKRFRLPNKSKSFCCLLFFLLSSDNYHYIGLRQRFKKYLNPNSPSVNPYNNASYKFSIMVTVRFRYRW